MLSHRTFHHPLASHYLPNISSPIGLGDINIRDIHTSDIHIRHTHRATHTHKTIHRSKTHGVYTHGATYKLLKYGATYTRSNIHRGDIYTEQRKSMTQWTYKERLFKGHTDKESRSSIHKEVACKKRTYRITLSKRSINRYGDEKWKWKVYIEISYVLRTACNDIFPC